MPASLDQKELLRTAYQIMYVFATRYWKRGQQADSMTNFITDIGPVGHDETCDPAQIGDWLAAADYVLSHPELGWADYGKVELENL